MAIGPGSYAFSGGAFMGGGGTEVTRDDIHTLTLTRRGSTVGDYNPLDPDKQIDLPTDVVLIEDGEADIVQKIYDADGDGKLPLLIDAGGGGGGSWNNWYVYAGYGSDGNYYFFRISENVIEQAMVSEQDGSVTYSTLNIQSVRFIETGSSGDDRGHEHTRIQQALQSKVLPVVKYYNGSTVVLYGALAGHDPGGYRFLAVRGNSIYRIDVVSDGTVNLVDLTPTIPDPYIKKVSITTAGWLSNYASANHFGSFGSNTLGVVCEAGNNKHYIGSINETVDSCGCLDCGLIIFIDEALGNKFEDDEARNISVRLTVHLETSTGVHATESDAENAIPDGLWLRAFTRHYYEGSNTWSHGPLHCGAMVENGVLVKLDTIKLVKRTSQQPDTTWVCFTDADVIVSIIGDTVTFTHSGSN